MRQLTWNQAQLEVLLVVNRVVVLMETQAKDPDLDVVMGHDVDSAVVACDPTDVGVSRQYVGFALDVEHKVGEPFKLLVAFTFAVDKLSAFHADGVNLSLDRIDEVWPISRWHQVH